MDMLNEMVREFLQTQDIDFLDLTGGFREYSNQTKRRTLNSNDFYWNGDGHMNIKGNKLAALLISYYLLDKRIVPVPNAEVKKREVEKALSKMKNN